jgi:hypothetical protein
MEELTETIGIIITARSVRSSSPSNAHTTSRQVRHVVSHEKSLGSDGGAACGGGPITVRESCLRSVPMQMQTVFFHSPLLLLVLDGCQQFTDDTRRWQHLETARHG